MYSTEHILQLIKKAVNASSPNATVVLYGSYARGDNSAESDIDLLILIDKETVTHRDRTEISYPLYDIQFDAGVRISPVVCPVSVWQSQYSKTPFYDNILREGVVL